ncbi:SapC family protein [uncultured Halomonas sp.]|uniref:SapC family protein n=1 Tax=uncultured Halomonas sp. TaxID=173971 RepID=UPI002630E0B9|nr:SapC family protein [uncultured Halomonas sp.]
MSDWKIVSRRLHAGHGWLPRQGFHFALDLGVLPVVLAEVPKLLSDYVIAFVGEGEALEPVVITDIGLGRNLYVDAQGRWLSRYVPAELRAYPFGMVQGAGGKLSLGIRSEHLAEPYTEGAQPLFDHQGEPSADVAGVADFLLQRERQRSQTREACRLMVALKMLVPWPLKVRLEKGAEPEVIPGLWRVKTSALDGLDGETLKRLNDAGVLPLAALQPITAENLPSLLERGRFIGEQTSAANTELPERLDDIFSQGDEISLDFGDD